MPSQEARLESEEPNPAYRHLTVRGLHGYVALEVSFSKGTGKYGNLQWRQWRSSHYSRMLRPGPQVMRDFEIRICKLAANVQVAGTAKVSCACVNRHFRAPSAHTHGQNVAVPRPFALTSLLGHTYKELGKIVVACEPRSTFFSSRLVQLKLSQSPKVRVRQHPGHGAYKDQRSEHGNEATEPGDGAGSARASDHADHGESTQEHFAAEWHPVDTN